MNYFQILLLALIQGAAELLPVSSSAHVILTAKLMGLKPSSPEFVFLLVMLHTGTMFAVLYYFWPRWRWLWNPATSPSWAGPESVSRGQFLRLIVLATICTGVLGLGLKVGIEKAILPHILNGEYQHMEDLFKSLPLIAICLFVVGIFIILAGRRETKSEITTISTGSAIWIGLVQGLCLPFRGLSRSGATISTGLCLGIRRSLAEEFSFALAVVLTPPVNIYSLYKLLKSQESLGDLNLLDLLLPGLVGMIFSFAAGLVALKLLSAALEQGGWKYFGYYCIGAAGVVLAAGWAGY